MANCVSIINLKFKCCGIQILQSIAKSSLYAHKPVCPKGLIHLAFCILTFKNLEYPNTIGRNSVFTIIQFSLSSKKHGLSIMMWKGFDLNSWVKRPIQTNYS